MIPRFRTALGLACFFFALALGAIAQMRMDDPAAPTRVQMDPVQEGEQVPIAVIVNADNKEEDVSFGELKKIYRGDRKFWKGTDKILLLMLDVDSKPAEVLLKKLGWESKEDYEKYWVKKIFRGEASAPPEVVKSAGEMRKKVRAKPNAIGLVVGDLDQIKDGIKALKIDGKGPGEEGYPLTCPKSK